MRHKRNNILPLVEGAVESLGYMFVDLSVRGTPQNPVIEIFVDSEEGITSDDCAKISRTITEVFEKLDVVGDKFRLDVSSPGIDRPLKYIKQYPKNVGRNFEVMYEDDSVKEKIKGKLVEVKENDLFFETKNGQLKLPFEKIITAKVLISL